MGESFVEKIFANGDLPEGESNCLENKHEGTTNSKESRNSNSRNNNNNDMDTRMDRRIRLVLHAVDGCIPYLNPSQLEKHFPPSDDFWIGLAVRDTCVVPVFDKHQQQGKKSRMKNNKNNNNVIDDDVVNEVVVDTGLSGKNRKARGYTFAPVKPDPWLLPYIRLTVPAFDTIQNGDGTTRRVTNEANTNKNGKGPSKTKEGNNHVLVWTPHGRQKLTPDLYSRAALDGLQSQYTTSLYEVTDEQDEKRIERVKMKNENWLNHLIERACPDEDVGDTEDDTATPTSRTSLWAPVLFPADDDERSTKVENTSTDFLSLDSPNVENPAVSGVAFVGRWRSGLSPTIKSVNATWKAVLATHSLSEILDIATDGNINVIGTGLPATWAKKRLALGIDITADHIQSGDGSRDSLPKSTKRRRLESGDDILDVPLDADGCMDLTCKVFARDSRPLIMGCSCMACDAGRFSRAYIHHLVCAKELLAEILIFGHNLHTLMRLIRTFNGTGDRNYVKTAIKQQLNTTAASDTII